MEKQANPLPPNEQVGQEEEISLVPVRSLSPSLLPVSLNDSLLQDGRKELDGWEEFSTTSLFWVSLNPQKGVIECKRLGLAWTEILCQIVDCRVIRVAKDEDGLVSVSYTHLTLPTILRV